MIKKLPFLLLFLLTSPLIFAQQEQIIQGIMSEAKENSQLEPLAHELLDVVGPRLVGTPQLKNAHDWAVEKYKSWDIAAENQQWGTWKGWERGTTHIDMISPRVVSLEGQQLAWSPGTSKKGVTAEVIILPEAKDSVAFKNMMSSVKGKFVMISQYQPTGRPDYNWEEFATDSSFTKMKSDREKISDAWDTRVEKTGYTSRTLPQALEKAGAAGIITSYWSRGFGVNKIFGARTTEIPTVDISLEDYGMLYRRAETGDKPEIKITAESKDLGEVPTFNTIARME
ncbi:MAG: peptidase M28, partial [Leeuwenhoekiella sp.]